MTSSSANSATPNRLADATSPYLRQHANNPVDWYEWGPEALHKAKADDKPILLSVGYSACHWCHVMAHESFEDPAVAAVMNDKFVNIKVDREERPDIDAIYQRVVQLMGEGGGWPLTVFLTPDAEPYYGGTYFPPQPRYGRPGFLQLLHALHDAYRNRPEDVQKQVSSFMRGFAAIAGMLDDQAERAAGEPAPWDSAALRVAARRLLARVDDEWGGFGRQPKFPNPSGLEILLRIARGAPDEPLVPEARAALRNTLEKMYRGGIYDHLRGGFARYSVDRVWLVPHFEKMLYDNAQLLALYAEAAVSFPDDAWLWQVVRETVAYLVADMRTDEGTFYAATDADSEGEEGKYFCWTPAEVAEVLGDPALTKIVRIVYGVSDEGNFEHGWSILNLPRTLAERAADLGIAEDDLRAKLELAKSKLLAHRYTRVPPLRDDKVLTSWVALLVTGLCRASAAAAVLGHGDEAADLRQLAVTAAQRLVGVHVDAAGKVLRAEFRGTVHIRGVLDDVAFLARACLDLHELTLDPSWRAHARRLAEQAIADFIRPTRDGFFFTAADAETLIERTESQQDGPIPSGVAVILEVLARLDVADDAPADARAIVEKTLHRFHGAMAEPFAYAGVLLAASLVSEKARHVKIRAPDPADPGAVALASAALRARLFDRHGVTLSFHPGKKPDAIVCRGQVCAAPLSDPAALVRELGVD